MGQLRRKSACALHGEARLLRCRTGGTRGRDRRTTGIACGARGCGQPDTDGVIAGGVDRMTRLKLLLVRVQPVIAVEDGAGQCERVIEEEPRVIAATEWPGYSERLEREL